MRSYISEPDRGRRNWKKSPEVRDALYRNRRAFAARAANACCGSAIGTTIAHLDETGGVRRVYLRGHTNILKRLPIHTGGLHLGLLMRELIGVGTLRGLQGRLTAVLAALPMLIRPLCEFVTRHSSPIRHFSRPDCGAIARYAIARTAVREVVFTTMV